MTETKVFCDICEKEIPILAEERELYIYRKDSPRMCTYDFSDSTYYGTICEECAEKIIGSLCDKAKEKCIR